MTATQELADMPLVFVVDDDDDTRANLSDILEIGGYRVQEAASAQELLSLSGWNEVALVLLDRRLPDGSPDELLPTIKERAPHAGVIIVTGYADIEGAVNCLRAGAADYIVKPINPEILTDRIARELRRQRADCEIARLNQERKRSAESLARSEQRHRALFENAMDGFLILDEDWRIVDVNPAACTKLCYDREELVGRHLNDLIVQAEEPQLPARFLQRKRVAGECKFIKKDDGVLDIEYRAVANFSPGLNLFSLRNVTDRKRAEERARQSERLAAIGETMAALVHESRNALQRSSACLEMLELEVEDRPSALDLVARAQRAQEQLRQLYEEVRQWAAPLNLRRQEFDVAQVWREAWHQVIQLHPAGRAQLKEEVQGPQLLKIDRFMVQQVFRNTFENAIDVTPPGGRVWLRCTNGSADEDSFVRITIRDEGPGLTPEQQARIFEPFFTTKAKGTGLGMAISQRIVQAHEGTLAASSPGGAEIEITLSKGDP
jgi:two-component system, LuxR family, sensor kinase FixL